MPTLNWIGKDKVVNHANAVPFHVLEYKYNFGGESENKIIHGDNLLALKSLLPEYEGCIKCVYIDPPYNTGAKDWKYNNDYVDGNDQYRHSKWLSMMQKRLRIAKKLLNPSNSVLIVTIDEKEYLHLGCLLEEVFQNANIQMMLWYYNRAEDTDAKQRAIQALQYMVQQGLGTEQMNMAAQPKVTDFKMA